jgi:excisionase family DNA binding protein
LCDDPHACLRTCGGGLTLGRFQWGLVTRRPMKFLDRRFRLNDDTTQTNILNLMQPAVTPIAVDAKEAAGMLRVSVKTIRREVSCGNLAAVRIGKYLRIRIESLQRYLLERESRVGIGERER